MIEVIHLGSYVALFGLGGVIGSYSVKHEVAMDGETREIKQLDAGWIAMLILGLLVIAFGAIL